MSDKGQTGQHTRGEDSHVDRPLSNDTSRGSRIDNLLNAKGVGSPDGIHEPAIFVLELGIPLLLLALGLGLLQLPSMAHLDTTVEGETAPFATGPGHAHDRVPTCYHDTSRDSVDSAGQDVEDWDRGGDVGFGQFDSPAHRCCVSKKKGVSQACEGNSIF